MSHSSSTERRQTTETSTLKATRFAAIYGSLIVLTAIMLQGCVSDVKKDIQRHRASSFRSWMSEQSGGRGERQVLSGGISLKHSMASALGRSREIQLAIEEQAKAKHLTTEAWADVYPRLDLDASYTRLDRLPLAGGGSKNNYDVAATITLPLFRGGGTVAGIRKATLNEWLTDEQFRGTRQQIVYAVKRAYYDAVLARELLEASKTSVTFAERLLADTQKDKAAGIASEFDVIRARVEVKNFTAQQVQAENRYRLAVATLLDVMGVSQESKITLTDPLRHDASFKPVREDAVRTAFMRHPDLLQAELSIRMNKQLVKAKQSALWPRIDAFFSPSYARPKPDNPARSHSWGDDWYAGFSLTYTLFEGFRTMARIAQARDDLRASEIVLKDAEERILLQIQQAILSMEDANKFVESQKENRKQAEEALRLVNLGYDQGIRKQVEVLDAQRALDEAKANYWQAVYQHEVAKLDLEKATGILDREPMGTGDPRKGG